MPTLTDFIKFLTERSHTLRMLGQNKPKTVNTKQILQKKKKEERDDTPKEEEHSEPTTVVNHNVIATNVQDVTSIYFAGKQMSQVILSTAQVFVQDSNGNLVTCRALLDPGSQFNLITADLVQRLKLQQIKRNTIISGVDKVTSETNHIVQLSIKAIHSNYKQQLQRFWEQETLSEGRFYTEEEKRYEKQFLETTTRDVDGRFIVRLPVRPGIILGESRSQAQRRFEQLERRLVKQPQIKQAYCEFMREYEELHHMTLVEDLESLKSKESYFIPHQAVVRPDSVTTKLRVVFDASAKTTFGTSLNDKLMPGPNLQKDLLHITLRFRVHEYVVTADIKKMFRQILIHQKDRVLQLIFWREDARKPLRVYQLNTVTYGTASAPYHAIRCLKELATIYRKKYPAAARILEEDMYTDDISTGARTIQELVQICQQLEAILLKGQFCLHKWRFNNPDVLQQFSKQQRMDKFYTLNKEEPLKTLGILWDSAQDQLQYQVKISKDQATTKREVLSRMSQIFDPLGLVGPVLIKGKLFMQKLWSEALDWDQPLSQEHIIAWDSYYSSLSQFNDFRVPRNVNPQNIKDRLIIFGFSDASEKAYGACIYVVSTDNQGNIHSYLLCSKSRVAPLKTLTLPRLELKAALLLSKLYNIVKIAFKDKIEQVRLWSDSTIVLG
ncbi:uncharacterized protein LOC113563287 [Ooceraea biroi]|uniref:uncharacterized protein LOC113563287 n=1 Tax=Ooceraea biroi TaxID=2015173 RepID=UPI000F08817F|nr:uncharacterized protein LOC113563287 [Ooceraea biroi]